METIVIGIAGGTGSGKSTFTNKIKEAFGDKVSVLYHDSYYRCNDDIPFEERKSINYDHPDALETELLVKHLRQLKKGEAIMSPVYDFSIHNRLSNLTRIEPTKVIVVEGILVLQSPELRDLFDIKIYVDADADERILRRAIRDVEERGRDLQGIMKQYLTTVKPMHYQYVEPSKAEADIVINSGMNEVAFDVIRTKIESLLKE
ncbi:MAG: uridine kinase [Eubacteriales bacterium]|nr:uridine kinase [Eubacteriales bacterium]